MYAQAMLHPDYGTTRERTRYRGITWEPYETTTQQYLSICKWQSFATLARSLCARRDEGILDGLTGAGRITLPAPHTATQCSFDGRPT